MLILKITESGHTFDLPGMNGIKTPTEINISKMSTDLVLAVLRRNGITKYEILNKENIKKIEEPKIEKVIETIYINNESPELRNKVDNIETLLVTFLNNFKNNEPLVNEKKKIQSIIINEEDVDFVPSIDISGMSSKGSAIKTVSTLNDNNDIKETANLLKSFMKNTSKA